MVGDFLLLSCIASTLATCATTYVTLTPGGACGEKKTFNLMFYDLRHVAHVAHVGWLFTWTIQV